MSISIYISKVVLDESFFRKNFFHAKSRNLAIKQKIKYETMDRVSIQKTVKVAHPGLLL